MTLKELVQQAVVVAGLGVSGMACVRFLRRYRTPLTLWDTRTVAPLAETPTEPVWLGELPEGFWQDKQVLIVSPGLSLQHPEIMRARAAGLTIIGEIELFARANQVPAAGITGTNGKTTVTLLLTHILQQAGLNAQAGGNVGTAALDLLAQPSDVRVLELSSFQLETTASLQLATACILNLTDDHLDRHGSMAAYAAAKQRIFANAQQAVVWRNHPQLLPANIAAENIVFYDLTPATEGLGLCQGQITWQGEPVLATADIPLLGDHNLLNVMAAMGMAWQLKVPMAQAAAAVKTFVSAPHRCEKVIEKNAVVWIDDSKATNVGATLAAIAGISRQHPGRIILIAGGDAKGADLRPLAAALSQVALTITLGRDGAAIAALAPQACQVTSMAAAVQAAGEYAQAGDIVLLSPACASLDMFNSYVHRAQVFRQEVLRWVNAH